MSSSSYSSPNRLGQRAFVGCGSVASLLLMLLALGCQGRPGPSAPPALTEGLRARIALFPTQNLTAAQVPLADFHRAAEEALRNRGISLVRGDAVLRFLSRHRKRHAGGLSGAEARAVRSELGAEAVLLTALHVYKGSAPPKVGITMRLVATSDPPEILWSDSGVLGGSDAPGILELGKIRDVAQIATLLLERIVGALADFLAGVGPRATPCQVEGRFAPAMRFLSADFDPDAVQTIAVFPFKNESKRRAAGAVVALEVIRQLHARKNLRVLEPGIVREELLRYRVVMEDGVSLDTARILMKYLDADLAVSGTVFEYEDQIGDQRTAKSSFALKVLARGGDRLVWAASSRGRGDAGVFLFDWRRIRSTAALTCRLISASVDSWLNGEITSTGWLMGPSRGKVSPGPRPLEK